MSKKVMLSQPMNGKTNEEIVETKERAIKTLEEKGYEVINTYFADEYYNEENIKARGFKNTPIYFLSKSLGSMAMCDAMYFCKGWENAKGCRVEHEVAKEYGMEIMYEEDQEA